LDFMTEAIESNLVQLRKILGTSPDVVIREITLPMERDLKSAFIYLENMADPNRLNEDILRPLMTQTAFVTGKRLIPHQTAKVLKAQLMTTSDIQVASNFNNLTNRILAGEIVLVIDGINEALIFPAQDTPHRAVEAPEAEDTVRGPRESFVEVLAINLTLLRRRIRHPDLTVETYQIGQITHTTIKVVYLKGVMNDKVVEEIRQRLKRIKTDGILGAGYIEQFIGDNPLSPFSTIDYSERPDTVAAKILEGRAAILIDGNPEVLTVPTLLIESFQNPDDYNSHPYYATLIRWIRYISFGFSILGPAAYIAFTSFNQELIPTPLFINLAAGSEGTPYPTFVEVIIMGLLFEIFREAGIHLPRPYGQGVTFVLALVMAQASVAIGFAGEATVAIVALTAIASLVVPKKADTSILIRLGLAILASIFGIYGIMLGMLSLLAHVASLRSFGVPYLAPLAPFNPRDFTQDVAIRAPLWKMLVRPRTLGWHNPQRQQESGLKPSPDEE